MNFREQVVHDILMEALKSELKTPTTPSKLADALTNTIANACQIATIGETLLRQTALKPEHEPNLGEELFRCIHDEGDHFTLRMIEDSVGFTASIRDEGIFLDAPQLRRLEAYARAAAEKLEGSR